MRRLPLALSVALLIPLPALAQDFHCRNTAAEIRCSAGSCEVETTSFTPMELTRHGDRLSICAYSGCWEGPIATRRTRDGIALYFATVRGSTPGTSTGGTLAVIHDPKERIAQIRWGGFASAMSCD